MKSVRAVRELPLAQDCLSQNHLYIQQAKLLPQIAQEQSSQVYQAIRPTLA